MLSCRGGASGETYAIPVGRDGHSSGPFVLIGLHAESIDLAGNRVVYSVPVRRAHVWSVAIPDSAPLRFAAAARVRSGTSLIELVTVSRDGASLLFDIDEHGNGDISRRNIANGTDERLISHA